jgi:predicted dienelactone hydrolase
VASREKLNSTFDRLESSVMYRRSACWGVVLLSLYLSRGVVGADYDPLAVPPGWKPRVLELTFRDTQRDRELPLRVYLPVADMTSSAEQEPASATQPAPVVLFSHGLGGARTNSVYLGQHWSARGYVAVFLQHPGSDDTVWKNLPPGQRMSALNRAASASNFLLRVRDVPAVIDQLESGNKQQDHPLGGRLDLRHLGMSGHSFGAVTTQAVSGQAVPLGGQRYTDKRIRAAIAFSPSSPRRGDPARAFGSVGIPWLLMTGTNDTSPIGDADVESRLAVYANLPTTIDRYELVLHDAEHSAFSDRALPGDRQARNPNHHRAILALSTAFWDAYLRDEAAAREWLRGPGARSVLEKQDRWQSHPNPAASPNKTP